MFSPQSQVTELRTLLERLHQRDIALRSVAASNASRAIGAISNSSESMSHYGFRSSGHGEGVAVSLTPRPDSDCRSGSAFPVQCDAMAVSAPWPMLQQQQPTDSDSRKSWLDSDPPRHCGVHPAQGCNADSQLASTAIEAGMDADATELCETVELGAGGAGADARADSEVDVYADQEHLWMGSPPMDGNLSS
jgi:hypothetical protein